MSRAPRKLDSNQWTELNVVKLVLWYTTGEEYEKAQLHLMSNGTNGKRSNLKS